jgi:hypothetical protein
MCVPNSGPVVNVGVYREVRCVMAWHGRGTPYE